MTITNLITLREKTSLCIALNEALGSYQSHLRHACADLVCNSTATNFDQIRYFGTQLVRVEDLLAKLANVDCEN